MRIPKPAKSAGTAEVKEEEGFLKKILQQLRSEATTTGMDIARDRLKNTFKHSRKRLFRDLRSMDDGQKDKIWEQFEEERKQFTEERFIQMLGYATDDLENDPQTRKNILEGLNELLRSRPDQFKREMYSLEDDRLQQWVQRIALNIRGAAGYVVTQTKAAVPVIAQKIGDRVRDEVNNLDDAAERADPYLRQFATGTSPTSGGDAFENLLLGWRQQLEDNARKKKGGRP